jgi:hypothetical protein
MSLGMDQDEGLDNVSRALRREWTRPIGNIWCYAGLEPQVQAQSCPEAPFAERVRGVSSIESLMGFSTSPSIETVEGDVLPFCARMAGWSLPPPNS